MNKGAATVQFIANLLPLYDGERHGEVWCARSLQDGTLIIPMADDEQAEGWVRIHWQGDAKRQSEAPGEMVATLALERYVRLHGVGATDEEIAAELWFMGRHFRFKTGCEIYLPQLKEPAHPAIRATKRMGEGVLVNLVSKVMQI